MKVLFWLGIVTGILLSCVISWSEEASISTELSIQDLEDLITERQEDKKARDKALKEEVASLKSYLIDSNDRWLRLRDLHEHSFLTEEEKDQIRIACDIEESNVFLTYKFGVGIKDPASLRAYKLLKREILLKNEGVFISSVGLGLLAHGLKTARPAEKIGAGSLLLLGFSLITAAPDGWALPIVVSSRGNRIFRCTLATAGFTCGYYLCK